MSILTEASLIVTPNAYRAGTLLSVVPSSGAGDMVVARNSGATRVNSAGLIEDVAVNVPRIDYSNGSCPSLLVEPQRTNLLTWSEDFSSASWGAVDSTIIANTTISPSGNTDADTMTITSSASRIFQFTGLGAGTYTASIYVKSLSGTPTIQFRMVVDGTDITESIPTTTDWVRHDFTFTASSSMDYFVIRGESGTGSVAIWGAQLEAGSYPTSYIPTTSASVTRVADVVSKTGISDLIGQTEGTMLYDLELNSRVDFNYILLGNLTAYIGFFIDSSSMGLEAVSGGLQGSIVYTNSNTGRFKIAIAYKQNDYAIYINGNLIGTDTSGNIPACSEIDLTFNQKNSIDFNTAALWKTRLTNDQLAQLTTL